MRSRAARWLRLYAVVVAFAIAVHVAVPASWEVVPYLFVSVVSLLAAIAGLRWNTPPQRCPWVLLATGLAFGLAGSVVWYALDNRGQATSVAHVLYLLAYSASVAGAWQLNRHRTPAERNATLLDSAIVTTGAAILMWIFVAAPTWAASSADGGRLTLTLYPMINLAIIAAVVRLALGGIARVRSFWLVLTALFGFFVADMLNAFAVSHGLVTGSWGDTVRLIGFGLAGATVLHPSVRQLVPRGQPPKVQLGRTRLAILWLASAAAPLTLVMRLGAGQGAELAVIALGSLVLFTLVLVRMWGLLDVLADYVRREQEDRFRALVENADDVLLIAGPDARLAYVSPSVEHAFGYTPDEVAADPCALLAPHDRDRVVTTIRALRARADGEASSVAGQVLHGDGSWRRFEATFVDRSSDPAIGGTVVTVRDVTTRWDLERQLDHRTFHDPLTGLPNRALFVDRVAQAIEPTRDLSTFTAVLLLDLDDFKNVNDVLGHDAGDELLRDIGNCVAGAIRPQDTAARLGGDEFGVLLPGMSSLHEVTGIAARLLDEVARSAAVGDAIEVRASLGIATSGPDTSANDLLREADVAMYGAKRENRGSFRLFDPTNHDEAVQRLQLKMDLRGAIERGELTVVYQPIHDIATEAMVGMEALLRWTHPTRGPISPLEFIALAEESRLIDRLGDFVLRRACADLVSYRARSGDDVYVTINVSPLQLDDAGFSDSVAAALQANDLSPEAVTLELTESIFLEQSDDVRDALARLRRIGVRLAIDDFGTGYCSLGYLNRFRFDVVKIDKSFIDALGDGGGDQRLTVGIMELIGSLEVPAIAEGVETRDQLVALQAAGCPFGQGYLWSKPVPIGEVPVAPAASPVGLS